MIITNQLNLPTPFVEMAKSDYECAENEYRVTSLLKSTREIILERRHYNEIETDAADMVWALFGTAVHSIVERHDTDDDQIKETRVKINIGDYVLSGQFDLYTEGLKRVTDYKTCSIWKIVFGDFEDWRKQTLIYCYMMKKQGFEADNAEVVAFMKDHSKRDAKFKPDYPKFPVKKIPFKFTEKDFAEIEKFITEKFNDITKQSTLPDNELNACTPEEKWSTEDVWAVMKKGVKKAVRGGLKATQQEAEHMVSELGAGHFIEFRPGEDKKCNDYCAACEFCNHFTEKRNAK